MASVPTTVSTLDGAFKERYADKLQDIVPYWSVIAEDIKFDQAKKLGDSYHFPMRVKRAHGVTFNGDGSAFALNDALSGSTVDGNANSTSFLLREQVSYAAASRATGSVEAFKSTFDLVVLDMTNSASFYRELCLLYGQSTLAGAFSASATTAATTGTMTVSASQWAPGLWAQMEGAKFTLSTAAGAAPLNTVRVTSVDMTSRVLTVQNISGNVSNIKDAAASGYVAVPVGQGYASAYSIFPGIDRICTNSTTLYGVSAATYGIFKANSHAAGGAALTMTKVCGAAAEAAVRSEMGKRVCYISTAAWTDLNNDHAALRRFGESTRAGLDLGTQRITYYGPTGEIEIVPHPMVKGGEAFLVDPRHLKRVGSSDISFALPGTIEGQQPRFFRELESNAGFELRCWWDQTLISDRPAAHTKITGIVNSTSL